MHLIFIFSILMIIFHIREVSVQDLIPDSIKLLDSKDDDVYGFRNYSEKVMLRNYLDIGEVKNIINSGIMTVNHNHGRRNRTKAKTRGDRKRKGRRDWNKLTQMETGSAKKSRVCLINIQQEYCIGKDNYE